MKRPIGRLTAAAFGAFAVVAAAVSMMMAAYGVGSTAPLGAGWGPPLLAGGAVGVIAWLLLSGVNDRGIDDAGPALTRCTLCGAEVLKDWRLCPYCGGSSEREPGEGSARNASGVEG